MKVTALAEGVVVVEKERSKRQKSVCVECLCLLFKSNGRKGDVRRRYLLDFFQERHSHRNPMCNKLCFVKLIWLFHCLVLIAHELFDFEIDALSNLVFPDGNVQSHLGWTCEKRFFGIQLDFLSQFVHRAQNLKQNLV